MTHFAATQSALADPIAVPSVVRIWAPISVLIVVAVSTQTVQVVHSAESAFQHAARDAAVLHAAQSAAVPVVAQSEVAPHAAQTVVVPHVAPLACAGWVRTR